MRPVSVTPGPAGEANEATSPARYEAEIPCGERWSVWLILAAYLVIQLNNIHNLAYVGQDFSFHADATDGVLTNPGRWFHLDITERPLIHWLGAACRLYTHNQYTYQLAAFLCVLLSILALRLLHDGSRTFIRHPVLRVAGLALVAFLPVTIVTAVVYAADTVVLLPFVLTCWSLCRSLHATTHRAAAAYALLACVGLIAGDFAKFTFTPLPIIALLVVLVLASRRITSWRRAVLIGSLAVLAPACVGGWLYVRNQRELAQVPARTEFIWVGTDEMTWRTLLFPKWSDRRILDAPTYWDSVSMRGKKVNLLLVNNSFSYPALLHLGIFTDVVDYADYAYRVSNDDRMRRPEPHKTYARWSVRIGLIFSIAMSLSLLGLWGWVIRAFLHQAPMPPTGLVVLAVFATAWFLPLTLTLPFVRHVYEWGYWLPRLTLPAIWGFALIPFALVDRWLPRRVHLATVAVAALVLLQVVIGIRSVWY
jgi:hypothetical protein